MNIIACRRNGVGQVVAEVAEELHVPCRICRGNCPHDHAQDADGILFLVNRIGSRTTRGIGEPEKPCLVVAVKWDQDVEFVRNWIQRKRISTIFITGNASIRASRQFVRAVLGKSPPPRLRRPIGMFARIFRGGWRCRALEYG